MEEVFIWIQYDSFLGHQVNADGVWQFDGTAEKLREMRRLNSRNEMEAFLDLCRYYRPFVPSYTKMAASLMELANKKTAWRWEKEEEKPFSGSEESFDRDTGVSTPNTSEDSDSYNRCK